MVKQIAEIKKNAFRLGWSGRGSLGYEDVLNLSQIEVDLLNQIIDENWDITKKIKMPYF